MARPATSAWPTLSAAHCTTCAAQRLPTERRDWTKTGAAQHRRASRAHPRRPARLHPHRQRASGRSGRGQGRLSHQRRGLPDPMGAGGHLREDQRGLPAAGAQGLLDGFPFRILGFHADNGSEYINHRWPSCSTNCAWRNSPSPARATPTTTAWPRPRTAAVVRKHLGYAHIPQRFAAEVNAFCREHLNPYLNFHRPCLFAEIYSMPRARSASATASRP